MNTLNSVMTTAIKATDHFVVDDHNDGLIKLVGVAAFVDGHGEDHLVALIDAPAFCINPLYTADNGAVHLARGSVGGTIMTGGPEYLEEALKSYNSVGHFTDWTIF